MCSPTHFFLLSTVIYALKVLPNLLSFKSFDFHRFFFKILVIVAVSSHNSDRFFS